MEQRVDDRRPPLFVPTVISDWSILGPTSQCDMANVVKFFYCLLRQFWHVAAVLKGGSES